MRKLFTLFALVFLAGVPASVSAQIAYPIVGTKASHVPAYTGPCDIATCTSYWGMRAAKSSTRGAAAVNVCNVSDVVCSDESTDASTGALTVTSIGGSNCSIVTCTVKIWYDQIGTNKMTRTAAANRMTFSVTCTTGSKPCGIGLAASLTSYVSDNSINQSQPFTFAAFADRTGNTGAFNELLVDAASTGAVLGFVNSANGGMYIYAGGTSVVTAGNDNAWHSAVGVFNGNSAASFLNVDGTTTSGSSGHPGTNGWNNTLFMAGGNGTLTLSGKMSEAFWYASAVSSGNVSSIVTNMNAAW